MKWCVRFPEEDILIKRPSLRRACLGNKATAAFLSYLLYKVSISPEFKKKSDNLNSANKDDLLGADISFYRTQRDIIIDMDQEISDRTLRDTAIPLLVALNYLHIDESNKTNRYTVHLAQIQRGIDKAPTITEILPILQNLINDSNTSDTYRKYFHRLTEILPLSAEILPTHTGNITDTQNSPQSTCEQGLQPHFAKDKSRKKNKDTYKSKKEGAKSNHLNPATEPSHNNATAAASQGSMKELSTSHTSRTAETVLSMIESLRGYIFTKQERVHQLRSAALLLKLEPPLTLQDISDAWKHGSDDYWRNKYDLHGMNISDLINLDRRGRYRIFAVLEHKQRLNQEHRNISGIHQPSNKSSRSTTTNTDKSSLQPKSMMTQQDAEHLTQKIIRDGQMHGYDLQPHISNQQGNLVINIRIGHHSIAIHSTQQWQQEFARIYQILQLTNTHHETGKDFH